MVLSHGYHMTTTDLAQFHHIGEHDDGACFLFPYHPPEVLHCAFQGALGSDVLMGSAVTLGDEGRVWLRRVRGGKGKGEKEVKLEEGRSRRGQKGEGERGERGREEGREGREKEWEGEEREEGRREGREGRVDLQLYN